MARSELRMISGRSSETTYEDEKRNPGRPPRSPPRPRARAASPARPSSARPRQIGGAHQAVVAAADHDRVIALGHANLRRRDEWDSPDCTRRQGVDAGSRRRHRGRVSDADPRAARTSWAWSTRCESRSGTRATILARAAHARAAVRGCRGGRFRGPPHRTGRPSLVHRPRRAPRDRDLVPPLRVAGVPGRGPRPQPGRRRGDTAAPVGLRRDRTRRASGRAAWPVALPAADDITAWTLVQLGIAVARGGAYFALASGLRAVDRSIPSPTVAGLASLVGA